LKSGTPKIFFFNYRHIRQFITELQFQLWINLSNHLSQNRISNFAIKLVSITFKSTCEKNLLNWCNIPTFMKKPKYIIYDMSITFSRGQTKKKKEKYAIYEIGIRYLSNANFFFMIWKCKYDYRNLRHISKRYLFTEKSSIIA